VLFSMNRPAIEKMEEIGNQIRLDFYRIPKKNYPSMVQNQIQFTDAFRKHECYNQSFELSSTETSEGFTSLTSALFATQDGVLMDLESQRDGKYTDHVISKLTNDRTSIFIKYQYLALLVLDLAPFGPNSCAIPPLQFVPSEYSHCIPTSKIDRYSRYCPLFGEILPSTINNANSLFKK
jgi:hypothetical protein